jgi:hypothetical protein
VIGTESINGVEVFFCHSFSGQHMHAHKDYWQKILPVPTMETGCPKPGRGSNSDWWIGAWAPGSVCKTGKKITCVAGLVSTFATRSEDSTWGNQPLADPGLFSPEPAREIRIS